MPQRRGGRGKTWKGHWRSSYEGCERHSGEGGSRGIYWPPMRGHDLSVAGGGQAGEQAGRSRENGRMREDGTFD
eukprot:363718-Chlamydomonas_euryale.AAC.7